MSVKIKRHPIPALVRLNIHTTLPTIPEEKPPPKTKEVATQTDPQPVPKGVARKEETPKEEKKEVDRPFLLIHSRDIEADERELLKTYGSVFEWDPSFVNIPLSAHPFDYCLLDIHHKDVRMLLMKTDLTPYHVVIVSRVWESEDDFHEDIQAENVIHSFPPRQAFAAEFNRLLLTPKIRKPSCAKALLRFVLKACSGC